MRLGFLYAGQGSQRVGMGQDFYETYPAYRRVMDGLQLPFDVKGISFTDKNGLINQTQYTQPAMVAFAAGVTAVLAGKGIHPAAVTGLSLGEYSALHGASALSARDAVELVAYRGQVMAEAAEGLESSMVAVLGLERQVIQEICAKASAHGVVEVANYNTPAQTVIGGESQAVAEAVTLAKEAGAKGCIPLKVSGPFHTSLLKSAGDQLGIAVKEINFTKPNIPVMHNCLGGQNSQGEPLSDLLARQVYTSVYLEDCIRSMGALNLDGMVEIGPGKVLTGFVKKILPQMKVWSIDKVADVDKLCQDMREDMNV